MSFVVTGHCQKCGSPIWSPMLWGAAAPPPNHFTCNCNGTNVIVTTALPSLKPAAGTTEESAGVNKVLSVLNDVMKRFDDLEKRLEQVESSIKDKKKAPGILKD